MTFAELKEHKEELILALAVVGISIGAGIDPVSSFLLTAGLCCVFVASLRIVLGGLHLRIVAPPQPDDGGDDPDDEDEPDEFLPAQRPKTEASIDCN